MEQESPTQMIPQKRNILFDPKTGSYVPGWCWKVDGSYFQRDWVGWKGPRAVGGPKKARFRLSSSLKGKNNRRLSPGQWTGVWSPSWGVGKLVSIS